MFARWSMLFGVAGVLSCFLAGVSLEAALLTGSGNHLPIPSPNPGGPPGIAPTLVVGINGFTGTWTPPAMPAWVGTFNAFGPVPSNTNLGTTRYFFTTLPGGLLPTGTFFLFGDVDNGSGPGEILDLQAYDALGNPITTPWLDEPIGVWGSGTGIGGSILAGNMPGWDWNNITPNTYRIDGNTVTGGNPTVGFALVNNQPIARLDVHKASTFNSFALHAPVVPEPATLPLIMIVGLGLGALARYRRFSH
jgi:hypothetical protein